jgi:outer membrane protein OmpA-like peptidoglycan-associated protein
MRRSLGLAAVVFALLGLPAQAQQPRSDVSVEELVQALTPPARTRSLNARNLRVEPARIDLTVNFDFDSARLKDDSKPQLERLAEALRNERLMSLRFQVEGHTDAQGTASYNDALSAKRADAVVGFLTQAGVERERLQPLGKGFRDLLDPSDPKAAKNRRVRILTLE